jgi:hypothetical protein
MSFIRLERLQARENSVNREEFAYHPVFKPEPFANELLRQLRPQYITLDEFDAIVDKNKEGEAGIIRFGMVRKIDVTGFVPNLLGSHTTPQQALETFDAIAAQQLEKIDRLPPTEREEVFRAMESNTTTLQGIRKLVRRQDEVMRILEKIREKSPLAQCVRELNAEAVKNLYRQDKFRSVFDDQIRGRSGVKGWERLEVLYTGEPRVCYIPWLDGANVKSVDEYYFTPNLWRVILTGPIFNRYVAQDPSLKKIEGQSVGRLVNDITPDVFKRKLQDKYLPNSRTLIGFMALVGKGTSHFYRDITDWMNLDKKRRAAAMKDDEAKQAIRNFFNRD